MMKKILVIGAGLSSSYLIRYLLEHAQQNEWHITVADSDMIHAEQKVRDHAHGTAFALDIADDLRRSTLISQHDVVISMLPASLHIVVAKDCLSHKKHLITASYISPELQQMHAEALKAGLLFLNECGLDPGIDHLSAMKLIHGIRQGGGIITGFQSFCGGLISPEYDNNPWNYKFTWNPRNVVVAGQATARYLDRGELKFIPPTRIFTQTGEIRIPGYGDFESYANRDSLGYIKPYGIESAETVLRGTLRRKGFSASWNHLVRLGLTDDTFVIHDSEKLSWREWVSAFVPGHGVEHLEERVCDFLGIDKNSGDFLKLEWLGLFSKSTIGIKEASPAFILQSLLQEKWKLEKGDLDMIVMHHDLHYSREGATHRIQSSLVVKGEDETFTAMAKTVGLPMGIATKLLMKNQVKARGVVMPVTPEFYNPILEELATYGIQFMEHAS